MIFLSTHIAIAFCALFVSFVFLSEIGHMAPNWSANDPYPKTESDKDEAVEDDAATTGAQSSHHASAYVDAKITKSAMTKEAKEKPANVLRTERAVQRHAAWVCI